MGPPEVAEGRVTHPASTETAATTQPSHLSVAGWRPVQAGLFDVAIPNHPLHPAEADLRLVVNTLPRGRTHWWLADVRRHHRRYPDCQCRRCMGWGWAA